MRLHRACVLVCLAGCVCAPGCWRRPPAAPAPKPVAPPPIVGTAPAGTYTPVASDKAAAPQMSVAYRFEQGRGPKGDLAYSSVEFLGPSRIADTQCVWVPVPGRTDRVIEVHIPRKGDVRKPTAMYLRMASLVRTPAGNVLPTPGVPPVVCRLNAAQAAIVMSNDLPPELIATMDGAAAGAGWRPMPDGFASTPAEIVVNPTEFFSAKDPAASPPAGGGPK